MYRDVAELREREKELNCLYKVTEVLSQEEKSQDLIFRKLVNVIPEGWQYPGISNCRICLEDHKYTTPDFFETLWYQSSEIIVDGNRIGSVEIFYSRVMEEGNPFLPEEQQLLNAIADQIAQYLFRQRLRYTIKNMNQGENSSDRMLKTSADTHWRWRDSMARQLASELDMQASGVQALYVIGSTKEATAGPASDLDLLIHFRGTPAQKQLLEAWINGWSRCLSAINYQYTGYKVSGGLIDLHLITDEDIKKNTSYASMIGSYYNSARLLKKAKNE